MFSENAILKTKFAVFIALIICSVNVEAWDGYDWNEAEHVEIGRGNLVRTGEEIEVYHWGSGDYRYEEVQGMSGNELETYDYESGEYRYYEMD